MSRALQYILNHIEKNPKKAMNPKKASWFTMGLLLDIMFVLSFAVYRSIKCDVLFMSDEHYIFYLHLIIICIRAPYIYICIYM